MPLHSKGKRKAKDQARNATGLYKKIHHTTSIADHDIEVNEFNGLDVSDR
ncbi:9432_t:CDS:1, partial [Ambispora gerdemannii]